MYLFQFCTIHLIISLYSFSAAEWDIGQHNVFWVSKTSYQLCCILKRWKQSMNLSARQTISYGKKIGIYISRQLKTWKSEFPSENCVWKDLEEIVIFECQGRNSKHYSSFRSDPTACRSSVNSWRKVWVGLSREETKSTASI